MDEQDLSDVLCEFDAVMEDFTSPVEKRHFRYEEHLKTVKRRSSASVSDSGISDTESECGRVRARVRARTVDRKLIKFICLTHDVQQPGQQQAEDTLNQTGSLFGQRPGTGLTRVQRDPSSYKICCSKWGEK